MTCQSISRPALMPQNATPRGETGGIPEAQAPQQRRAVERRASYVEAARRLMLADGAHGVTMRAASKVTGGSKAAIYRYFTDRADLIDAVAAIDRERLEALFERYADAAAPRTEFGVVLEAVRAMVDLRTSKLGCVPISTNSVGRSRRHDQVAKYVWCIAARVHFATDSELVSLRLAEYAYVVASVDALLVRARRSATAGEKEQLMQICLGIVVAVLRGGEAA